jgi:hypothetical protein
VFPDDSGPRPAAPADVIPPLDATQRSHFRQRFVAVAQAALATAGRAATERMVEYSAINPCIDAQIP